MKTSEMIAWGLAVVGVGLAAYYGMQVSNIKKGVKDGKLKIANGELVAA